MKFLTVLGAPLTFVSQHASKLHHDALSTCLALLLDIWKATKEYLNQRGTKIRVFRVRFRAPFLPPFFPRFSPLLGTPLILVLFSVLLRHVLGGSGLCKVPAWFDFQFLCIDGWADPGVLWKKAPRAMRAMRGKTLETVYHFNRTLGAQKASSKYCQTSTAKQREL